jgi:hypothetical protein
VLAVDILMSLKFFNGPIFLEMIEMRCNDKITRDMTDQARAMLSLYFERKKSINAKSC